MRMVKPGESSIALYSLAWVKNIKKLTLHSKIILHLPAIISSMEAPTSIFRISRSSFTCQLSFHPWRHQPASSGFQDHPPPASYHFIHGGTNQHLQDIKIILHLPAIISSMETPTNIFRISRSSFTCQLSFHPWRHQPASSEYQDHPSPASYHFIHGGTNQHLQDFKIILHLPAIILSMEAPTSIFRISRSTSTCQLSFHPWRHQPASSEYQDHPSPASYHFIHGGTNQHLQDIKIKLHLPAIISSMEAPTSIFRISRSNSTCQLSFHPWRHQPTSSGYQDDIRECALENLR